MRHGVRSAACALLLSGCYHYVPTAAGAAPSGAELRVHLTPEGTRRVAPTLGAETTIVDGRVAGPVAGPAAVDAGGAGGLSLLVSSTTRAFGATTDWVGERVTIPVAGIARSERRTLDRRRSALVGGGVALAAAAGFAILRSVSGGGGGDGPDGGAPTP